jgi:hypothetical protein
VSEKEWEKLFELIGKAANYPGLSANEKGRLVRSKADENGAETDLDEFISQVGATYDGDAE